MKILVMSDTHGVISGAEEILTDISEIDAVIHLGDYYRDAVRLAGRFPALPFEYIYGNCDFFAHNADDEKLLEYGGVRIFITHGHKYAVKNGHYRLLRRGQEVRAQVVLFGHTHVPSVLEKDGCLLVNPGSISVARGSLGETYAILEIAGGKVSANICQMTDGSKL